MVAGSLLVAAGAGLAGLFSFRGDVGVVAVGFVLFFAGFRLAQRGYHDPGAPVRTHLRPADPSSDATAGRTAVAYVLIGVGLLGIANGVTLFSQTIVSPGLTQAVLSGVSSIGGYIVAHMGMMRGFI